MSSHIWYMGEYSIASGKAEIFKGLFEKVIETERSEVQDCLNFELFYNDDETKFYTIWLFRDSEAVFAHLQRAKDIIPRILEVAELTRFEVFGNPTQALVDAMAPFGAKMFGHWAGFTRLFPTSAT